MRSAPYLLTSVTRWLLVVIGCVVLETAQPVSAAATEEAIPRAPGTVIYPQAIPERTGMPAGVEKGGTRSWTLLMGALMLAGGGAWFMIKRRGPGGFLPGRSERKIVIEESRSLGNRQYLVVAGYEGKKFLIGVTPGQIQMLAPLDPSREET